MSRDRPLRVLRFTAFFHHASVDAWPARYDAVGGMQTQIARATLWLAKQGVQQRVVTLGFPGVPRETSPHPNVVVQADPLVFPELPSERTGLRGLVPSWFLTALASLAGRACRELAPDVIHVHADGEPWALVLASLLRRLCRAPTVLTLHCSRLAVYRPVSRLDRWMHGAVKWCERRALRDASGVIALTARTAEVVAREVPAARCRVIPDAIDAAAYGDGVAEDRVEAFRARFAISDDRPVVAFVGRIAPEKGWPALLELAEQTRDLRTRFLVIGDGPQRAALDREIARRGLGNDFVITAFVSPPTVAAGLRVARAVVMPSRHEELGGVALEAMASRIPVLGFAVGGLRQTIGAVCPDHLAAPDDVAGLAQRLRGVLAAPASLCDVLDRGWRHVREHHDVDVVMPRLLAAYREVAA